MELYFQESFWCYKTWWVCGGIISFYSTFKNSSLFHYDLLDWTFRFRKCTQPLHSEKVWLSNSKCAVKFNRIYSNNSIWHLVSWFWVKSSNPALVTGYNIAINQCFCDTDKCNGAPWVESIPPKCQENLSCSRNEDCVNGICITWDRRYNIILLIKVSHCFTE